MFRNVLLVLSLLSVAYAGTLTRTECPGADKQTGEIVEVYSPNFGDGAEIILNRGSTYTFGIRFIASNNSVALEPTIYGIIGGISVGWSGVNKEACNDLQADSAKCPIVAGREYHYLASIEVLRTYPATKLTFQWGLTARDSAGKKGTNHACFRMAATIK